MTNLPIRGILLDIEGTTSSISFVHDEMFPYAKRELDAFLDGHWDEVSVQMACNQIAKDAGYDSAASWFGHLSDDECRNLVREEVARLMEMDAKVTGLKQLQGLIWKSGFHGGELKAHVYEDVPAALETWNKDGLDVRIYSSGSISAQKLFFGHTIKGDLLPLLNGHYDTTTGPKKDAESYRKIALEFGLPAEEILFISDIVAELEAAKDAGLQTLLSIRPGNGEVGDDHGFTEISSFDEVMTK